MTIYQTIWLNPRRTIKEAVASKTEQPFFAVPIIIMGMIMSLEIYSDMIGLFDDDGGKWSLILALPIGIGISFLVLALIIPGLIRLTGKIWRGPATMRQMVNVCSLSLIPNCLILIYQLALLSFDIEPTLERVNAGITYLLGLWSFGLLIIGVAKVQRFSYGLALLNILMSYLPLLIYGLWRS